MNTNLPNYLLLPTTFADEKGPRWNTRTFRHKILSTDLWKQWKKKTGLSLDYKTFQGIWKMIVAEVQRGVMEEPNGVAMPYGLGTLYIGWVKPRVKPIDYKTSKQYGKMIFHENFHTYGKIGKIIYAPCGKYAHKYCKWWGFQPITPFKAKASQAIMESPEIFRNSKQKMQRQYGQSSDRESNIPVEEPGKTS